MKIGNFLNDIDTKFKQHTFSGISFHSKNCFKNCIYFSVKGKVSNGNHFINEAIDTKISDETPCDNIFKMFSSYLRSSNLSLILL